MFANLFVGVYLYEMKLVSMNKLGILQIQFQISFFLV